VKKVFVTGAAGFVGSHLSEELVRRGMDVVGWDNLSTGHSRFLESVLDKPGFTFIKGDNLKSGELAGAMNGCETVFHLAANADVRFGLMDPKRDFEQNTVATFHVLEAMRANHCKRVVFSSTGSVYGEAESFPTPENVAFPMQTSLYGASKLAGEGMVEAYCEGFGFEGYIFRFVSILGERYTHGHVLDFCRQLRHDPSKLVVLGDGNQRKSYLYVTDCVQAMLHALELEKKTDGTQSCQVFNLGTQEYCTVKDSISWICKHLHLEPKLEFTGGERGWVGDSPWIFLDTQRIRESGWEAKLGIREAVLRTVEWLKKNPWVFEVRA
jgi:UDP-glucose 4-epimerase